MPIDVKFPTPLSNLSRAAVVIGVDKPGVLKPLTAAAAGARKFEAWAKGQGFDVTTLTDTAGPVKLDHVFDAVNAYVSKLKYDQLIVYFSGHGFLLSPDTEIWLLSEAPLKTNEAVNLANSRKLARKCGIPNVVFISDACRTYASNDQFHQVSGGDIFPNQGAYDPKQEIDTFYGSMVGDPSYEATLREQGKEPQHNGIFTDVMLSGLSGTEPELVTWYGDPVARYVVRQRALKAYLQQEVPKAIARIDPSKTQDPDIFVLSDFPHFLTIVADGPPGDEPSPGERFLDIAIGDHAGMHDIGFIRERGPTLDDAGPRADVPANELFRDKDLERLTNSREGASNIRQVEDAASRVSFETRTGFTVTGGRPVFALSEVGQCELFEENNAWHIRIYPRGSGADGGGSIVIVFEGGFVTVLAALHGFVGAIALDHGRVINVSYTPSRGTWRWQDYERVAPQLERRRAVVAALARQGMFRVERGSAQKNADYMRTMKSLDPTLGLYAAYAYEQIGDMDGVRSVHEYMSYESIPIPFDVALLAERVPKLQMALAGFDNPPEQPSQALSRIAPFCPMLTQGWALMDLDQLPRAEMLAAMRPNLLPGLWVTLKEEGMRPIIEQLRNEWT